MQSNTLRISAYIWTVIYLNYISPGLRLEVPTIGLPLDICWLHWTLTGKYGMVVLCAIYATVLYVMQYISVIH